MAPAPISGDRREVGVPARLSFFYGPMDCGKSTLALQIDHNHARQGRHGLVLTRYDRSGQAMITTRVGLQHHAVEITDALDLRALVRSEWAAGRRVDYLVIDEAGFLSAAHVDQLAELVDDWQVDAYCFGLATDFRSRLLPGAQRLFELADELVPVHVEVLCWCGRVGQLNARVVDGRIVREGDTVLVADTAGATGSGRPAGGDAEIVSDPSDSVRYQVLCRRHYRGGDLGVVRRSDPVLPLE
ncbi:MAG: thymidine kinase [bacterium]